MLLNLNQKTWKESMGMQVCSRHCRDNECAMERMLKFARDYRKVGGLGD